MVKKVKEINFEKMLVPYLGLLYLLTLARCAFNCLWLDEWFAVRYCADSYMGAIKWAKGDMHPPFYDVLLHTVIKIFGENLFAVHALSTIPLLILLILCGTKLRKELGLQFVYIFATMISCFTNAVFYNLNVRMYSWSMLWGILAFWFEYKAMKDSEKISNWVGLGIFTILSAYTHYFATIPVGFVYIMMIIYGFCAKRRDIAIKTFVTGICFVIGFLPWGLVVIKQIGFTETFMPKRSASILHSLFEIVNYVFDSYTEIFIWAIFIEVFYLWFKGILINKEKRDVKDIWIFFGFLSGALAYIFVLVYSYISADMFQNKRYMMANCAIIWFAFAAMVTRIEKSKVMALLLGGLLLLGFVPKYAIDFHHSKISYDFTMMVNDEIKSNYVDGDLVYTEIEDFCYDAKNYGMLDYNIQKIQDTGLSVYEMLEQEDINRAWYFSGSDISSELAEKGYRYQLIGSGFYSAEAYTWFYEIEK